MPIHYGMEMKGLDKILVDTSAWIEFFRKREPHYSHVLKLIDDDKICCTGIILAELIQGARTLEEVETLKDFVHVFSFLNESALLWERAGELSFQLRKAGKQTGLADCYIAVVAHHNNTGILTLR
jgi:predicted nucleic acid-binding protein